MGLRLWSCVLKMLLPLGDNEPQQPHSVIFRWQWKTQMLDNGKTGIGQWKTDIGQWKFYSIFPIYGYICLVVFDPKFNCVFPKWLYICPNNQFFCTNYNVSPKYQCICLKYYFLDQNKIIFEPDSTFFAENINVLPILPRYCWHYIYKIQNVIFTKICKTVYVAVLYSYI